MLRINGEIAALVKLCVRTIAVLLAAYLAFWALATFAEHRSKPPGFGKHQRVAFLPLSASGRPVLRIGPQTAVYKAPYRYMSWLWDAEIAGARVRISVPRFRTEAQMGLMISARSDVLEVRFNDTKIQPDIRAPRLPGAFVAEPALYRLPAALKNGDPNIIELDVRRSLRDPIIIPDFAVEPINKLNTPFAWRNFMAVEAPLIGIVMAVFSTLLYIMIARPDVDKSKNLAFIGTIVFSTLSSTMFLFFDQDHYALDFYIYSITFISFGLSICAVSFAFIESGHLYVSKLRFIQFLIGLLVVSILVSIANYNGKANHFIPFNAYITAQLFSTGALVVAAFLLAWEIAKGGPSRFAERFLLIICFGAIALDRSGPGLFTVYSPFARETPLSLQWMPIVGSLVGCAMVFVLSKHAQSARMVILSANERLEQKLKEREAQLSEAYASRERIVAEQVKTDERQRIMRDMHDGLGSNIMSMLLAARRGEAEPTKIAEGLQSVIDEMRLLIDSMDSVGESLGSAFAMFRGRMKDRVEEAGMAFKWHDSSEGKLPALGPRDVLQVFRIMQEAVTNALKHSSGTVLSVTITPSAAPGHSIRIGVSDNGGGLGKANLRGKGMESMAARAAGIGGTLDVQSGANGVHVFIDLPER